MIRMTIFRLILNYVGGRHLQDGEQQTAGAEH